jgi:hypothetical protein
MDHDAEHEGCAIHPALQARISRIAATREQRIRTMIGGSVLDLATAVAALRRAGASTAMPPDAARILAAVEATLLSIDEVVRCWSSNGLSHAWEMEALEAMVRVTGSALLLAKELCSNGRGISRLDDMSEPLLQERHS